MSLQRKSKFDQNAAFKNIIGMGDQQSENADIQAQKSTDINVPDNDKKMIKKDKKVRLVQKAYYITEDQYKALKVRAATSDNPEEKDLSAIVRAALDAYL